MKVFAIAGSLRKGSYNRLLLMAAIKSAPDGMTFDVYDRLRDIPPFDQDEELDPPEPVRDLRARVEAAEAMLISTPEYNHGVPGVLKNAIDWLSRPSGRGVFTGRPVAIMGGGSSSFGAVRVHIQLRETLFSVSARVMGKPELILFKANERFDADGNMTDPVTLKLLPEYMRQFQDHIELARRARELAVGA